MLLINFLPTVIFSSSPKLNFFISKPKPIETAAAGVATFNIQPCICESPFVILVVKSSPPKRPAYEMLHSDKRSVIIEKTITILYFFVGVFLLLFSIDSLESATESSLELDASLFFSLFETFLS